MSGEGRQDDDVVTQAVVSFNTALAAGRLAQAYLVVGSVLDQGIPFAHAALGRLFCSGRDKPCGVCPACTQLEIRRHPDAVWIEPEKKSRIIDVERIRELQKLIYQTALAGGWKAVVLVAADRIGDAAANAFLKTLEEPPPRCLFLLLTDTPQAMLPTILSRCQRLVLSSEAEGLPEPWRARLLDIMASPMEGGLKDRMLRSAAIAQLLDDIRTQAEEEEETRSGSDNSDEETFKARVESRYRGMRRRLIRAMVLWYRDVLVLVCGSGADTLCHADRSREAAGIAQRLTYRDALANVRVIEGIQRQLERNVNQDSAIYNGVSLLTA